MATVHPGHPDPQRTLVVFFSRDGHTRQVATELAAACHADLEEIAEFRGRAGPLGYGRSALEALLGIAVRLKPSRHAPQDYGLVLIGTPVWFWNMSSPVRAWVHEHRARLPRVAFFCTLGGSGADKVFGDLERLAGKVPVATLALTEAQCNRPGHHEQVREFAHRLGAPRGQPGTASHLRRAA